MIAWKAKYGYGERSAIESLDEITFTDEGPFSIPTGFINVPDGFVFAPRSYNISTSSTVNKIGYEDAISLSNALQSILGEDYFHLYFIPTSSRLDTQGPSIISDHIPSATLACPNLFNEISGAGVGGRFTFIYIPALSKIVGNNAIYNVNGNSVTRIYSPPTGNQSFYGPYNSFVAQFNTNRYFWCRIPLLVSYNGTLESIINSDYYFLQVTTASTSHSIAINKSDAEDNAEQYKFYNALFQNFAPPDFDIPDNPYDPIDPSGPTNPDEPPGTFDDTSDPIPDSSLPTLSSANTGFTRIYNPTLSQVQALANYLWTDESVIETIWNHIKQYFEDPMQAIIGFNLVPVPVPDGGTEEFKLMYIGTGVNMIVAASQFVDVDCGTLELKPYYGSYLDYAPYTKISCFLPYIGNVEINPDEVMNTTLQVKYRVDICSGSCVAKILVDNNCLYQYSGHCAIPIPFSSADFSSYVSAAISVAKLGIGVATAGALGAAGIEAGEVSQATTAVTTTNTERNPATGRQITTGTQTVATETSRETKPSPASYAGITPRNISNTVGEIMGSKPAFQHSGSFSGNTGYLGVRRPFLIITRPNLCLPASYKEMNGYPSMITMLLSECKGYTQVQQVQFTGTSATNPEVDEILQFLKSGVIF